MPLKFGNDLILYDAAEVAKLFKVTPLTVKAYIHNGKLEGRTAGKKYYASETSLAEFFNTLGKETGKARKAKRRGRKKP